MFEDLIIMFHSQLMFYDWTCLTGSILGLFLPTNLLFHYSAIHSLNSSGKDIKQQVGFSLPVSQNLGPEVMACLDKGENAKYWMSLLYISERGSKNYFQI